jgi:beta-1,4-mannosyl-glycoprotein beta-1,4-N-acetylglucosaminyltransferase
MKRCWSISPFFNELDVLEVKLAEQAPWVDVFVFSESTTTYAGTPKPLHLTDALAAGRFAEHAEKIRVVVVDDEPPLFQPFQSTGDPQRWRRENHQRAALARAMTDLEADDVVCLSDLDEIVRGSIIGGYAQHGWGFMSVPPLTMHVGSLTHRWWVPLHVIARLLPGVMLLPCLDPDRWNGHPCGSNPEDIRQTPGVRLEIPGQQDLAYYGWHLSWMGGASAMRHKLDEHAHPEMSEPWIYDDAHLESVSKGKRDLFGRMDRILVECPRSGLPDVIANDFERWNDLLVKGERPGVYADA